MTPTEAAKVLGVTYDWVLRELRLGTLKGHKKGKHWVVDKNAVTRRLQNEGGKNGKTLI